MSTSKLQKQYATVIYLDYINRNTVYPNSDFPNYLKEELHVLSSHAFVKNLMRNGFIAQRERQLMLTRIGISVLRQNQDYVRFFEFGNFRLSIQEYMEKKSEKPQKSFERIIVELLREKAEICRANDDYESMRSLHLDIAKLYEADGYALQALHHYMITLYLDVSGLEYYDMLLLYIKGAYKKRTLLGKFDFIYIHPEIQAGIRRLKENYSDEIVDWIYEKNAININLCNKSHFIALVADIMNGKYVEANWQKYFRQAFERIVDMIDKESGKNV